MLKSKTLGRTLVIVGGAYLFRRLIGRYSCFGDYTDNSIEIITISFVLILSGIMILFSMRKEV